MTETGRAPAAPTLEAVAARAGVGRGTVSRVINGSPQVSARARAAVESAIQELGYIPNRAARSLAARRHDSIALVVSESESRVFGEPFFAGIIRGVTAGLAGTDLQLLLTLVQAPSERDRLRRYLGGHRVDGVLLISLHGDDPLPWMLEEVGIPAVLVGRPVTGEPATVVDADNLGGARAAVRHLIKGGRTTIATIAGPQDMGVGVDRLQGFHEALAEEGRGARKGLVAAGDFSERSGASAMRRLLRAHPELDAVFAASDLMAAGAMRVLKESGRRIPDDVAVVGFEDSVTARHTEPPLTSVRQPTEQMGREMTRLLLGRLDGSVPAGHQVVLKTRLIVRASS